MLIGEYDYEMDMQEKQEEIREEMQEEIEAIRAELNAKIEQAEAEAAMRVEQAKAEAAAKVECAESKAVQAEAKSEKAKQLLCSLVRKGMISVSEAAEEMGVSEETFLKWME